MVKFLKAWLKKWFKSFLFVTGLYWELDPEEYDNSVKDVGDYKHIADESPTYSKPINKVEQKSVEDTKPKSKPSRTTVPPLPPNEYPMPIGCTKIPEYKDVVADTMLSSVTNDLEEHYNRKKIVNNCFDGCWVYDSIGDGDKNPNLRLTFTEYNGLGTACIPNSKNINVKTTTIKHENDLLSLKPTPEDGDCFFLEDAKHRYFVYVYDAKRNTFKRRCIRGERSDIAPEMSDSYEPTIKTKANNTSVSDAVDSLDHKL